MDGCSVLVDAMLAQTLSSFEQGRSVPMHAGRVEVLCPNGRTGRQDFVFARA